MTEVCSTMIIENFNFCNVVFGCQESFLKKVEKVSTNFFSQSLKLKKLKKKNCFDFLKFKIKLRNKIFFN